MKALRIVQWCAPAALLAAGLAVGACSPDLDEPSTTSGTASEAPMTDAAATVRAEDAPYALEQPDAAAALPEELLEISGLTVLSSTEQAMIVLGTDGDLRHAWRLPEAKFEQPEGLAFFPGGDLFIASEGVDGPAMLFRFAAQR